MSIPNPEDWTKLDLIKRALSEFDKGMDDNIPSIPDSDAQQMFRSMQTTMKENGEQLLTELPKFEAECERQKAELKAFAEAAMREPEPQPQPEEMVEPIPVDLELGGRLRDEVMQHYFGTPVAQASVPMEPARTLEPDDFWSASLSLLSTAAPSTRPKAPPPSEAQKPSGSFDSWLGYFETRHDSNPPLSE